MRQLSAGAAILACLALLVSCGGGQQEESELESLAQDGSRLPALRFDSGSTVKGVSARQLAGLLAQGIPRPEVAIPSDTDALNADEVSALVGRALYLLKFPNNYDAWLKVWMTDNSMRMPNTNTPAECSAGGGRTGTLSVTRNDADRNAKVSAGDSIVFAAQRCYLDLIPSMDGNARVDVLEVSGVLYSPFPDQAWHLRTRHSQTNFLVTHHNTWGHATGVLELEMRQESWSHLFRDWKIVSVNYPTEWLVVRSGVLSQSWGSREVRTMRDVVLQTRLPTPGQREVYAVINTPQPMVTQHTPTMAEPTVTGTLVLETDRERITVRPDTIWASRIEVDVGKDGSIDLTLRAFNLDLKKVSRMFERL